MIFAFRDKSKWGEMLFEAGKRQGVMVCLFNHSKEVPDKGEHVVFVHMNHSPGIRDKNKKMMFKLAQKEVTLIPTLHEAQLYDNKIEQYKLMHQYMPESYIIHSMQEAQKALNQLKYPFISKASTGAGSSNVRLISTKSEAIKEINLAFGEGIPLHFNQKQKGYLFWQHFCPGNEWDWRVNIIAQKYACILKRYNRNDLPFASGSKKSEAINRLDGFTRKLLDMAFEIATKNNFKLCAMDFVSDNNELRLLETSVGWSMKTFKGRIFFQRMGNNWEPSGYTNDCFFDLVIKSIVNNEFK